MQNKLCRQGREQPIMTISNSFNLDEAVAILAFRLGKSFTNMQLKMSLLQLGKKYSKNGIENSYFVSQMTMRNFGKMFRIEAQGELNIIKEEYSVKCYCCPVLLFKDQIAPKNGDPFQPDVCEICWMGILDNRQKALNTRYPKE